eukprot:gene10939-11093_t
MMVSAAVLLIIGACTVAAASPGSTCKHDADCSYNGVCSSSPTMVCECDPAWEGDACNRLRLEPTTAAAGLRAVDNGYNTSTWGGTVSLDEKTGLLHMWASVMSNHCGIQSWKVNSFVVHAVASKDGVFHRTNTTASSLPFSSGFPVFTHEPSVSRGPNKEWVLYWSGYPAGHNLGPPCTACTNGSTPKGGACKLPRGGSPPTYMSWAPSPDGPWSAPVEVLAAPWDTNLAVVILSNGSAVVAIEDGSVYLDAKGRFHAIFHSGLNGIHTYSADGTNWTFGGTAWDNEVAFLNGQNYSFHRRERPHFVFGDASNPHRITALTTAVTYGDDGMGDACYTLLQPAVETATQAADRQNQSPPLLDEVGIEAVLRIEANNDALVADDVAADTVVPAVEGTVHSRSPVVTPQELLTSEIVIVASRANDAEKELEGAAPEKDESRCKPLQAILANIPDKQMIRVMAEMTATGKRASAVLSAGYSHREGRVAEAEGAIKIALLNEETENRTRQHRITVVVHVALGSIGTVAAKTLPPLPPMLSLRVKDPLAASIYTLKLLIQAKTGLPTLNQCLSTGKAVAGDLQNNMMLALAGVVDMSIVVLAPVNPTFAAVGGAQEDSRCVHGEWKPITKDGSAMECHCLFGWKGDDCDDRDVAVRVSCSRLGAAANDKGHTMPDGDYVLFGTPSGGSEKDAIPYVAYCKGGKTYLTFRSDQGSNFAERYKYQLPNTGGFFGQGGAKMCGMNEGYMETWDAGARTIYTRVRLTSPTGGTLFTIGHADTTFSTTQGLQGNAVQFGTAEDCVVKDIEEAKFLCPPKGSAQMDLSGTPFRVDTSASPEGLDLSGDHKFNAGGNTRMILKCGHTAGSCAMRNKQMSGAGGCHFSDSNPLRIKLDKSLAGCTMPGTFGKCKNG